MRLTRRGWIILAIVWIAGILLLQHALGVDKVNSETGCPVGHASCP